MSEDAFGEDRAKADSAFAEAYTICGQEAAKVRDSSEAKEASIQSTCCEAVRFHYHTT